MDPEIAVELTDIWFENDYSILVVLSAGFSSTMYVIFVSGGNRTV